MAEEKANKADKKDKVEAEAKAEKSETPAKAEAEEAAKPAKAKKEAKKEPAAEKAEKSDAKEKKAAKKESAEDKDAKAETAEEAPKAKTRKKPKRRLVPEGKAYIQASFNNTMVSITDMTGNVLAWSSAGANGFKGPKKATPYAAQISAEKAAENAKAYGVERVHVYIKGAGNGREQAMRGLLTGGIAIETIKDVTTVAHNGCRAPKTRRV